MAMNKTTEAVDQTTSTTSHVDPPPYSPRTVAPKAASPPPAPSATLVQVFVPRAPFNTDISSLGPEPANVICPRCHHGVVTSTHSRVGTHAGYLPRPPSNKTVSGPQLPVLHVALSLRSSLLSSPIARTLNMCVLIVCPPVPELMVGGFLMARYQRGVSGAKVFPVDTGYVPVAQEYPSAATPPASIPQPVVTRPAEIDPAKK